MKYASQTEVSVEKSRAEIEKILTRYGATKFAYFTEEQKACIAFEMTGKRIRFMLPLPNKFADEFKKDRWGYLRADNQRLKLWEQACRQRWRALTLAIKAKLEWVETGIVSVEEEFLPYIVTASGKTVAEMLMPQLTALYESGVMPRLLSEHTS